MTDVHNEMSSCSSPPSTTTSSSPMNDSTHNSNNDSSATKTSTDSNRNSLNAPKYGTPVPNRVFVGGIPTDAKESDVKQLFSQFGTVIAVKIITDRAGVPRGYGFVTYETEEDAKRVMKESDNLLIKNRKLNISVAIKKQQFNDYRSPPNGTSYTYPQYSIMNAVTNGLYPDMNGLYSSEGIPLYSMGVNPQLMANGAMSSTQSSYPYQTYQTPSGLYLATSPASLTAASQLIPQFQTSGGNAPNSGAYPLLATPYRLPLASQNVNQMNPYIHMSSATSPPLSQSSSMPIQVHTSVANSSMMTSQEANNAAAMNAINNGMSALNFFQPPVYAIQTPNTMQNSSQSMQCVHNVQLKADNGPQQDMSANNGTPLMHAQNSAHQVLELMPLWSPQHNVPNVHNSSQPKTATANRYMPSKTHQNHMNPSQSSTVKDRPDNRRNNSSFNNSQNYRKSANSSTLSNRPTNKGGNNGGGGGGSNGEQMAYGGPQNHYNNGAVNYTNYDNECQKVHHNNSLPNVVGLPFVKHYSNNRYHTLPYNHQPVLNVVHHHHQQHHQQQSQQHHHLNGSVANGGGIGGGQPPMVPKIVNGVPIYTVAANNSGGNYGSYGSPLTPPLTPGTHQMVHK